MSDQNSWLPTPEQQHEIDRHWAEVREKLREGKSHSEDHAFSEIPTQDEIEAVLNRALQLVAQANQMMKVRRDHLVSDRPVGGTIKAVWKP